MQRNLNEVNARNKHLINVISLFDAKPASNQMNNCYFKLLLCKRTRISHVKLATSKKLELQIRFLFRDESGYIEAIASNSVAIKLRTRLELDKVYIIDSIQLANSTVHFKEWPEQELNSQYDLMISNSESIKELDLEFQPPHPSLPIIESSIFKVVHVNISTSDRSKKTRFEIAKELDDYLLEKGIIKPPKFYLSSEIHTMKPNSFVNVIAVIHHIEKLKFKTKIDRQNVEELNVILIDESDLPIRVMFWSSQAVNFHFSTGSIVTFYDLEIMYCESGTLCLNAHLKSKYMLMEESFKFENVEKLRKWWQSKYMMNVTTKL